MVISISYKRIQLICILYIVLWMIAPPLAFGTVYRIIAVIAAVIWTLIHMSTRKYETDVSIAKELKIFLVSAVVYSIALWGSRCIYGAMSPIAALYADITTYIILFMSYVGGVYCREDRYDDLKIVFCFSVLLAVFFSLTTLLRGSEYQDATRYAGLQDNAEAIAFAQRAARQGIGAFGFFCYTAVLAPITLWISCYYKGKAKVLTLCAFLVIEMGVISAGYTIALLISAVGISLTVILNSKSFLTKYVTVIGLLFAVIFWDEISTWLYSVLLALTEGSMYEVKVRDIFSFLLSGTSTGTFEAREERYLWSLYSIFRYPFFGSYLLAGIKSAGYHSSILDTFATYGWVIGAMWLYMINIYPIRLVRSFIGKAKYVVFIILCLTGLLNSYTMTMSVFAFIVPAMARICQEKSY